MKIIQPPANFKGVNLIGEKFHRLTVISFGRRPSDWRKEPHCTWMCQCECGNVVEAKSHHLKSANIGSCGCYNKEVLLGTRLIHGHARKGLTHPAFFSHQSMMARMTRPNAREARWYSKVRVCDHWREPKNFLMDMRTSWFHGATIDRINPRGHYSCGRCSECRRRKWPKNVRWATLKQQARNRTNSVFVTWKGQKRLLIEWCEELGLKYNTVMKRIQVAKWSVNKALTTPIRKWGRSGS